MPTINYGKIIDKVHFLEPNETVFYTVLKSGRRVFITYDGFNSNPQDPYESDGERIYYTKLYEVFAPANLEDSEREEVEALLDRYKKLEVFVAAVETRELRLVALDAPVPWLANSPACR